MGAMEKQEQGLESCKGIAPAALVKTEIIPLQTNPEMSPGATKL